MAYKNYSIQTISHQLRHLLEVTCDEYCMLLFIFDYYDGKDQKTFKYTRNLCEEIKRKMFFSMEEQIVILRSLIKKEYFTKKKDNVLERNNISLTPFQTNKENFEELWKAYGRVGNKQKALEAYNVCVRQYGHQFLMERTEMYLEHLEIVQQSQLHLSSFLNPKIKQFLNEFKSKKKTTRNGTFFK